MAIKTTINNKKDFMFVGAQTGRKKNEEKGKRKKFSTRMNNKGFFLESKKIKYMINT